MTVFAANDPDGLSQTVMTTFPRPCPSWASLSALAGRVQEVGSADDGRQLAGFDDVFEEQKLLVALSETGGAVAD